MRTIITVLTDGLWIRNSNGMLDGGETLLGEELPHYR